MARGRSEGTESGDGYLCWLFGEEEGEDLADVASEGIIDFSIEVGHKFIDQRLHLLLHNLFHLSHLFLDLLPEPLFLHLFDNRCFHSRWVKDLNLNRISLSFLTFLLLNLLLDLLHDGLRLFLLLLIIILLGGGHFHDLFNIHLDLDLNILNDLLINSEWPIWEEELDGHVVIDAEQFAGGQWESINLKRFVLVASLLIVRRANDGDKFYELLELVIAHTG